MSWDMAIAAFLMIFLRHGVEKMEKREVIKIKELLYLKTIPMKKHDWNYLLQLIAKLQLRAKKEGTIRHILRDAVVFLTGEMTSGEKYRLKSSLRKIKAIGGRLSGEETAVIKMLDDFVESKDDDKS